ncbi:MAG: glycosyltransferase [Oscillospiraceae bacterium]|nr:glycosyltransferase [Oscillospiraceae bacterium]
MSNNHGTAREQFMAEAAALKKIIYEMIEGGHLTMAAQMLEQYTLLNPDDPDINEIKAILYPEQTENIADINNDKIPDEYSTLNDVETIFILSGIITKRTGYIDSVLRKIKLMEDTWNYKPLLLTCIHNIDNRQAIKWLETAGQEQVALSAKTRVLNVYEYFQKSYADGLVNKAVYSPIEDENRYIETSANAYDIYDGDELIRKEYYTGYLGSLRTVRYYKDGKADKDMIYDDWGYLNFIRQYIPGENNQISEDIYEISYYTTDGKLCIKAFFKQTDNGLEHEKLVLYNENEEAAAECANSAELAALCLERFISVGTTKLYMLVVEDGLMSRAATMTKNATMTKTASNIAICCVVHSIFLNDAYKPESGPQRYYEYLCNNRSKFNSIIMLTEEAGSDFSNLYGGADDIFILPHPYPYEINKIDFNERDPLKAVVISRLDPLKQIDLTITIFAQVVKKIPQAKLEIYGRGPEEASLKKLISKLDMKKNIFLKGYTDQPLAVFNKAVLSIFTSQAEGYGLTLMESICNGCPVFAFDIKYGPSEIIDNEKTGFLFPRFDTNKFANEIIKYLNDVNLQKSMSENCYKAAHKFNTHSFMEKWYEMTKTLHKRTTDL